MIGEEDVEEMWAVAVVVVSGNLLSPWMMSWFHTMEEEAHVLVTSYSNPHLCNKSVDEIFIVIMEGRILQNGYLLSFLFKSIK